MNDVAKAAFRVAKVTFEVRARYWYIRSSVDTQPPQLMKEQNKYDQIPMGILNRLRRILSFADKVADEIVGEETDVLEKTIPRMFKVMETVSKYSCGYVKRGRFGKQSTYSGSASADISQRERWVGWSTQGKSKKWTKN